jgi:hypothetical protein
MSCIMNGRMDVVKRQERGMAGTMTAEDAALSGASAEGPLALAKPTGPLVEVRVHVAHRWPMTNRYG